MPSKGDEFIVVLSETHVAWGVHRYTNSRDRIKGETYIPIPRDDAKRIGIYNREKGEGIGYNEFYAKSTDGFYEGIVKVSGNISKGDPYAKNIAQSGNLKGFSEWFDRVDIRPGTIMRVEWTSNTEILFTKLK